MCCYLYDWCHVWNAYYFAGPYLIVITQREKVGEVDQKPVWKVTGTEVISYQRTLLHLNEQQVFCVL